MEWLSKVKVINKDLARFKESLQFVVYAFYIIVGIFHDDVAFYAFFVLPRHASQVVESLSSLAEGGPALLSLARPYNCPREV